MMNRISLRRRCFEIAPRRIVTRVVLAAYFVVGSMGCSPRYIGPSRPIEPAALAIADGWTAVPNMKLVAQQESFDCGTAAAVIVLRRWELPATLAELASIAPKVDQYGLRARDVRDLLRARGLRSFVIEGHVTDIEHEITAGRPVVVGTLKRISDQRVRSHFEVVAAVNIERRRIVTLDPALGWRQSSYVEFEQEWSLSHHATIVTLPAEGERSAAE